MKKTYAIPELKLQSFLEENIVTNSVISDPTKTTKENVDNYISSQNLGEAQEVLLTW